MIGALLLAAATGATPVVAKTLVFADKMVARGDVLTLGQVADLQILPADLRQQASVLPLMKRAGDGSIEHRQLASRARSLMPALSPWLRGPFKGHLALSARNVPQTMPMANCGSGDEAIVKGAELIVHVTAGPFNIQRDAIALQSGRPGERLFVRTTDGEVLVAQCEGDN
ncbi:MAG: hypothetical protein RL481_2207 [Pseudomonadota bacterium]